MIETDKLTCIEATKQNSPTRQLLFFRLVAIILSVAFTLLCVEIFMRLIGVPSLKPSYGDPVLGWDTPRNSTSTFDFPEYGGMLSMRRNNLGFHEDEDTQLQKSPGTTRVIVVGDSQTAGECANFESYPNVLERMLNTSGHNGEYEILNAGVGKYSPYQYYVKTEHQLVPLKPDHLIVGFYVGNDLMDIIRRDDRPYLTLKPDGGVVQHAPEFVLEDDPAQPPSLLMSIRLYGAFRRALGPTLRYQLVRAGMLLHDLAPYGHGPLDTTKYMIEVKRLGDMSTGFLTQSLLQQLWFHHFPETLPTAFRLNREVMIKFKDLCARNGIRLTYVLIPTKLLVEPSDFQDVLAKVARYDNRLSLPKLQAFENQITDEIVKSCSDLGIEVLDLRRPLMERRAGRRFYNPFEMHLTPEGNRAIGYILYKSLRWGLPVAPPDSSIFGSSSQSRKSSTRASIRDNNSQP